MRRCHFEEVALGIVVAFAMVSVTSSDLIPVYSTVVSMTSEWSPNISKWTFWNDKLLKEIIECYLGGFLWCVCCRDIETISAAV